MLTASRLLAASLAVFLAACAAPPSQPRVTQFEAAPGVTLHVEIYGDGPEVVFVPNRLFMANEFRALAAPDRTLVLYDMRNRGASTRVEDGAQLTIMHDVEDLEALRRELGAERVSLVGYSYLGLMVALYAAEHPDRVERIVQIGPVPRRWNTPYPAEFSAGEDTLSEQGRAAIAAWDEAAATDADQRELCTIQLSSWAYWSVGDPANASRYPDVCMYENEWPANFDRHLNFHFADIQTRDFPREMFTAIEQPVLTIHGRLDRNAPYGAGREWAQTFPNGRLITVAAGAHHVWLDDPAVLDDIDAFLRGRWPERAERVS